MANITPLTLLFEFLSPLIVTLFYLVFFRKRKNRFIEAFIILMYVKMVTSFLYYIWYLPQFVPGTFDAGVDGTGLSWLLVTDLFFQFTYTLQEYLTWIMVSFFAVLFGMLVLAVKLTLQDPLKMRFSNVIRRITRREPESDGFSGLRDRVNNLRFEGIEPQPLDPEVQSRAWREAWRDYLIIGLATLLPSIGAYLGSVEDYIRYISGDLTAAPNTYVLGVLIFLTWIYRFGYPASNRIAKGAGTKLGDRDIGSEMMRGVLGWFFRLNILLSIYFIIANSMAALGSGQPEALLLLSQYYIDGLVQASPPILFAIILLPLTEDFAVILYKKTFDAITRTKEKIARFNVRSALTNLGAAIGTGGLVTGAFVGAVMAVTLHFAHSQMGGAFLIYPGSVATTASTALDFPSNNLALMPPTIWILMMLAIPLASMLLIGVLGHVVRTKIRGGLEGFALFAGITVSVATWQILPGMDFVLGFAPTPANLAGSLFYRIRPVFEIPSAELILYRLAYQFIVNLPIYVFSALFILYFFEYRRKWREQIGEESGPLLNIHASDIYQAVGMFVGGLVVAVVGVLLLSFMIDPSILAPTIGGLFAEIANPNGLELVLQHFVETQLATPFLIIAEHNIVRTLLMLVLGPIFWSAVLWFVAVKNKSEADRKTGMIGVLTTFLAAAATIVWVAVDMARGAITSLATPWNMAAQIGLRAGIIFGLVLVAYILIAVFRLSSREGIGAWWFPAFVALMALEYFIYDDQFTLIALIILPMIIAGVYKLVYSGRQEVRDEDLLLVYIRFSLMSIAISEVLSTALIVGGISVIDFWYAGSALPFLSSILPHAVIEIPTFLIAAAASIRIAKDLGPHVTQEDWESIPAKTRTLVGDERTWRTFLLIVFFLLIAAMIEAFVTPIIFDFVLAQFPPVP